MKKKETNAEIFGGWFLTFLQITAFMLIVVVADAVGRRYGLWN